MSAGVCAYSATHKSPTASGCSSRPFCAACDLQESCAVLDCGQEGRNSSTRILFVLHRTHPGLLR